MGRVPLRVCQQACGQGLASVILWLPRSRSLLPRSPRHRRDGSRSSASQLDVRQPARSVDLFGGPRGGGSMYSNFKDKAIGEHAILMPADQAPAAPRSARGTGIALKRARRCARRVREASRRGGHRRRVRQSLRPLHSGARVLQDSPEVREEPAGQGGHPGQGKRPAGIASRRGGALRTRRALDGHANRASPAPPAAPLAVQRVPG